MPDFRRSSLPVLVLVLALPACAADPGRAGVAPPTRIPDARADAALNQPLEQVPTAAVPAAIRRLVVADAAAHWKVAASAVVLARAERVTWSDASLGCPRDSGGFIQAIQPGFRIVAKTSTEELVYHTNDRTDQAASVVRCPAARR